MACERIDSLGRFREVADEWDALAAGARSPLLEHDWFISCAETLHAERSLRIAAIRDAGTLQAAAPLALEPTTSGARLTLLGASRLHEPSGWVFSSAAAVAELADAVMQMGLPVHLPRIGGDSPVRRALTRAARRRAAVVVRHTAPSLAVAVRGTWLEYHAALTSQIRVNLPRLRRKAERAVGALAVARLSPSESEVDGLLGTFLAVEGSGWKGRRGSSLAQRPELQRFFRAYCRRAATRGRLRVTVLRFGGAVGAVELAVEAYGRLWQLKIGYAEALAGYYPGLHLVEASIRAAFERGLEGYEFLGSAEPWEERWQPEVRTYQLLAVYPYSLSGLVGAGCDLAGIVWRRALGGARPMPAGTGA